MRNAPAISASVSAKPGHIRIDDPRAQIFFRLAACRTGPARRRSHYFWWDRRLAGPTLAYATRLNSTFYISELHFHRILSPVVPVEA